MENRRQYYRHPLIPDRRFTVSFRSTDGTGAFSGEICSAQNIGRVQVVGNITGNSGSSGANNAGAIRAGFQDDQEIASGGSINSVVVGVDITGGVGHGSGAILAAGDITSVLVRGNLQADQNANDIAGWSC